MRQGWSGSLDQLAEYFKGPKSEIACQLVNARVNLRYHVGPMAQPRSTHPQLLHEFFEASARREPDGIAVDVPPGPDRVERSRVTYRELNAQADALAARVRPYTGRDGVVGVLLPRTSHWVYVAQLAVLKAGGAFACIDPGFPDAHVQAVLDDAEVSVLLTDKQGQGRIARAGLRAGGVIDVASQSVASDSGGQAVANRPSSAAATPDALAYVIYTSGTTGVPKGVMIEHRSVVNLVVSDIEEFALTPADRVGQGSSAAYDSSIEEIWLAFAAGATVVVMDDHTSRMGPDLVAWLRRERVSVFCPPPTLLRTTGCTDPGRELPDLKLLYVGGEALTDDLVALWAPGRRMVNGYGPTECTVTVVRGDVTPGSPVTIGKPVPGHTAWVVDAELRPVPDGDAGELCLAGPGVARGYRNREEVTRQKFPVHPALGRVYRTGDLVRRKPCGDLVYLGRIDAQVKLRGYRIELEAIEAHLVRCEGVREAACTVQGQGSGALLAAHIVPTDANRPPAIAALRESLRRTLPSYMVPARFWILGALPRSVGGKVDRKKLPEIAGEAGQGENERPRAVIAPCGKAEAAIVAAFASALRSDSPISTDEDFFLDLGGDSLTAVAVICSLRLHHDTASITTRDLYDARTAAHLAARAARPRVARSVSRPDASIAQGHVANPHLVTLAQTAWLLLQLVAASAASYAVLFELMPVLLDRLGIAGTLLAELPLAMIGIAGYALVAIGIAAGLKWTLIGRYRPITTPVWSWYYFRHWIVRGAVRAIPWNILAGTVAYGVVLRLLGAKVGRRVHIHRGVNLQLGGWDLLTLGDDVTLARDSSVGLVELHAGCLVIGPVTIRDFATLEARASVGANTTVEVGGSLTALSWLPEGERIGTQERWDGVPAAHAGMTATSPACESAGQIHPATHAFLHIAAASAMRAGGALPALAVLATLAWTLGLSSGEVAAWFGQPSWSVKSLLVVMAASVLWVPVWLILKALCVRLVGRVRPSAISLWSLSNIRVAHKVGEVEDAGRWLSGTLFWPIWLRLAGMKIGRGCEISTIIDVVPESLRIGDHSFFADGIYLGGPRIHRGVMTIRDTSLGRGTFLGNHVVVPPGERLPDDLFIGVSTVADSTRARPGTSWFGHPTMELPRRDVVDSDRRLTHNPSLLRYTSRLFWESLRFTLPTLPLAVVSGWLGAMSMVDAGWVARVFLGAPVATLGAVAVECFAVLFLKWALLGRAKAGQHALWSCWCSRWDFLYVAWQFYAMRPLEVLEGTLLLNMYLRAMGLSIGRRVVLGPGFGQVADPDMITIEDDATVSANYQAHSFEDRVLKLAPVVVRRGATVGEAAVVFYGADIGEDAWVTPNSVVMKNERLSPGAGYCGCPVQTLDAETDKPPVSRRVGKPDAIELDIGVATGRAAAAYQE